MNGSRSTNTKQKRSQAAQSSHAVSAVVQVAKDGFQIICKNCGKETIRKRENAGCCGKRCKKAHNKRTAKEAIAKLPPVNLPPVRQKKMEQLNLFSI